ncbi:MAG: lamin tail domain-containing protein, partial [Candidatus Staskawiczbacteria bacterium]|nr:lamin tail domain-containing protein [Candidatus Staskawiczbacteria bacterium]
LPNPSGADETNEWVELYNSNNSDVDLSGWQLKDIEGTATTFIIPQNTKILANGFLIFKRPNTKIMLNNDADGLNLLTPDKKIIDSVNYTKAPLGQSYNKNNSGWQWSTTLTQGATNIITTATTKVNNKSLSKTKISVNNNVDEAGLPAQAGLAELIQTIDKNQVNNIKNPWFLFF